MKLALIGNSIQHSLSPSLYKEFLKENLESYDLLEFSQPNNIPSLAKLSENYDGINITSPYKKHFFNEVIILSEVVKEVGAINALSFTTSGVFGTNTDVLAVEQILKKHLLDFKQIHVIVLGGGVMAHLTHLICHELGISFDQLSRSKLNTDLSNLDLLSFRKKGSQNIIINACSRDFVFKGNLSSEDLFWDYNYSFRPHESTIPSKVKLYQDGREMLRLQALAAIEFWQKTNSKLKY